MLELVNSLSHCSDERNSNQAAKDAAAKKARDEKQKKITSLLATAEKQLLNTELNNAYNTYKQVLKIDSRNTRAKAGVTRVADRYLSLANTSAVRYDFDKANSYINSVIKIDPTNNKLAETQQKVFDLKNEQLTKQAEEQRLAEEAKRKQQIEQTAAQPAEKEPEKKRRSFGGF